MRKTDISYKSFRDSIQPKYTCEVPQGPNFAFFAAFLWKKMSEAEFPVTSQTAAPIVSESQDVRAALAAAGGGRGAESMQS